MPLVPGLPARLAPRRRLRRRSLEAIVGRWRLVRIRRVHAEASTKLGNLSLGATREFDHAGALGGRRYPSKNRTNTTKPRANTELLENSRRRRTRSPSQSPRPSRTSPVTPGQVRRLSHAAKAPHAARGHGTESAGRRTGTRGPARPDRRHPGRHRPAPCGSRQAPRSPAFGASRSALRGLNVGPVPQVFARDAVCSAAPAIEARSPKASPGMLRPLGDLRPPVRPRCPPRAHPLPCPPQPSRLTYGRRKDARESSVGSIVLLQPRCAPVGAGPDRRRTGRVSRNGVRTGAGRRNRGRCQRCRRHRTFRGPRHRRGRPDGHLDRVPGRRRLLVRPRQGLYGRRLRTDRRRPPLHRALHRRCCVPNRAHLWTSRSGCAVRVPAALRHSVPAVYRV